MTKKRPDILERQTTRFLHEPPSVRAAARVIVSATAAVVVVSGVLIRILDHGEYPNVWIGMWWALQTVTTVGYGDVTPKHLAGRLVGVIVMLQGVALLSIVTAAITSTFVQRAARETAAAQSAGESSDRALLERRFDELEAKIDRLGASPPSDVTPPG